MPKNQVLSEQVPNYAERKSRIEAEPLPESVGALLDDATAEVSEQLAVDCFESGHSLTYRELREEVNRLANGMRVLGIRKGTHVGAMLPNIIEFPITWLALARIGAVMVPLNIAYTPREFAYVVDKAGMDWLVIHESCLSVLNDAADSRTLVTAERVITVGEPRPGYRFWNTLSDGRPADFVESEPVGLDDLLNIQFTSGTTGFPKGVMLTQGYWLVGGKQNAFRDGRVYKRILASTPFFYMDPQWQLLMTLYQRGTLYVAERQSGSRYMQWIRKYRINFGLLPEVVVKQPPSPKDAENEIVKVNVYGISKDLHHEIEDRFNLVAREAFGMTEIGTGLFMPIEATDMVGSGSCGVAAPFREARIVNLEGNPVPDGETGELQIRGRYILNGYYNDPEATQAAFAGEWFRTGDLFRRDENGFYTIVGRVKDMIRRAGENISAREVESVIAAMPEVIEAAAVPVKDGMRGEEVKAYIVLQQGVDLCQATLAQIIAHCSNDLAPFKVPRYYEFRQMLPKTASGKTAKLQLISEKPDLRQGSFDRISGTWI